MVQTRTSVAVASSDMKGRRKKCATRLAPVFPSVGAAGPVSRSRGSLGRAGSLVPSSVGSPSPVRLPRRWGGEKRSNLFARPSLCRLVLEDGCSNPLI